MKTCFDQHLSGLRGEDGTTFLQCANLRLPIDLRLRSAFWTVRRQTQSETALASDLRKSVASDASNSDLRVDQCEATLFSTIDTPLAAKQKKKLATLIGTDQISLSGEPLERMRSVEREQISESVRSGLCTTSSHEDWAKMKCVDQT
jgi:hypothetical protein